MASHKPSQRAAGGRGKRHARDVVSRPDDLPTEVAHLSNEELQKILKKDGVSRIEQLIVNRNLDEKAVDTLDGVMDNEKATPSAKVSAARTVLEYSHGKPHQNKPAQGGGPVIGGLHINIIKYNFDHPDQDEVVDVTPEET